MKRVMLIFASCMLVLGLIQDQAYSQCGCGGEQPDLSGGYDWTSGAETAEIPFRLVRNHILVPVHVNGRGPFEMILDTGMPADGAILFESEETDSLDLEFTGRAIVQGAPCAEGCGDSPAARVAFDATLGLPGVELKGQAVTVLDVGATLGPDLHAAGIIGLGVFGRFLVRIDYDRSVITLKAPENFRYDGEGEVIPFTSLLTGIPEVILELKMGGGEAIPVQVVVDTGAGHVLSLHVDEDGAFSTPEGAREAVIGRSMWGEVRGQIGRIANLHLGKYSLEDVPTTFTSGERVGPAQCGKNGNLGNAALQRFHVIFDYAGKRMIIEPNSRYGRPFADPFEAGPERPTKPTGERLGERRSS